MGLITYKIQFDSGIPPFSEIEHLFNAQTGLNLWITADINLPLLLSLKDVNDALGNDSEQVRTLLQEQIDFRAKYPEPTVDDYEKLAGQRDEINKKLSPFVYVRSLFFNLPFYEISFKVEGNCILFEVEINQFYGVQSLLKTLITPGGTFVDEQNSVNYQKRWKKLKPWNDYKWFNRPKK